MPKGGARTRSGPPPDPNALRRSRGDDAEWITLPATGRGTPAPEWPLPLNADPDAAQREALLWQTLWLKPQAVAWERFDLVYDVALYARRFAEAEIPNSPTALSTLVRQMADALGLTVPGLRSLRWKIGEGGASTRQSSAPTAPSRTSARSRLAVVKSDDES